jgi:hypothetical protein
MLPHFIHQVLSSNETAVLAWPAAAVSSFILFANFACSAARSESSPPCAASICMPKTSAVSFKTLFFILPFYSSCQQTFRFHFNIQRYHSEMGRRREYDLTWRAVAASPVAASIAGLKASTSASSAASCVPLITLRSAADTPARFV